MNRRVRSLARTATIGLAVVSLAGCGGGDDTVGFGAEAAWSRPTPTGAATGVLYLTVTSDRSDALVGVDVPAAVAGRAELHTTTAADGGHQHHHGGSGDESEPAVDGTATAAEPAMTMTPVESFPIAAGGTLLFEAGGNHVMLLDLPDPLTSGETYTATLHFESGRTLDVDVVVAENAPD